MEWIIGLGAALVICFVFAWMLGARCLSMHSEIKKLERNNDDLRHTVKALKTQVDTLHNRLYTPDADMMTALKMHLHLKQEENDELREKVKRQNQLLRQKWEDAKNAAK